MATISLHGVAFAHADGTPSDPRSRSRFVDAAPLFSAVDFVLTPGFYGLVGANGAGKTTLLRLLAGELGPDEGHVRCAPRDASIALCPQIVDACDAAIEQFAVDGAGAARALRGRLTLDATSLARWPALSPGERKRWQVGAALASEPDVLLLDEPTNHLDAEARALVTGALARFRGVAVVVAHDRALLDALTTATLRVDRRAVTLHPGAFSKARDDWELAARTRRGERESLADAAHAATRALSHVRSEHASSARSLSAGRRMKNALDHDASSAATNHRAASAEARLARRVGVARAGAARAAAAVPAFEVDPAIGGSIFVAYVKPPRSRLACFDGTLSAGDRLLLEDVHVSIARGERVRVDGPNGAGKTTLLEALLRSASIPPERVLYVPQDVDRDAARRALDDVRKLPPAERGRALSVVAALGVDPDRLLASRDPSPGETQKLLIAAGLARHAWIAVLDEPTNHLDLASIERLERALVAFPGALIVVSHDASFLAGALDRALCLDAGRVTSRSLLRSPRAG